CSSSTAFPLSGLRLRFPGRSSLSASVWPNSRSSRCTSDASRTPFLSRSFQPSSASSSCLRRSISCRCWPERESHSYSFRTSIRWTAPSSIWLLAIPSATLFLAYGAYASEREKHERLELVYQSSRILQHSPELDVALLALLDHARMMFRAELAEALLLPSSGVD